MELKFFPFMILMPVFIVLIISQIILPISGEIVEVLNGNNSEIQKDHNIEMLCGGDIILDSSAQLIFSNDSQTPENKECIWRVIVPEDDFYRVLLRFELFEIKDNDDCKYNYIELRNGLSSKSPFVERFCGALPPNIYSVGRELFIKFVNNRSNENNRFSARLEKVFDSCFVSNNNCEQNCVNTWYGYKCSCDKGFQLDTDGKHCKNKYNESGTIDSRDCVNAKNTEEYYCMWSMTAPSRHRVLVNFTYFNLDNDGEKNYYNCPINSHVEIMSKLGNHSFQMNGPYCGTNMPPVMLSPKTAIDIQFHSNKKAQNSRFVADYSTVRDECAFNNGGCAFECLKTITSFECTSYSDFSLQEDYNEQSYYQDD